MKEIILSLTGKNSHKITLPLGQGSLSIGTVGMNPKKFDLLVEEDKPINWDVFNTFYIPANEHLKDEIPYGDWPRWFYYYGNDIGFANWTRKRKTELFSWVPQKSVSIDLSKSQISALSVHSLGHQIDINLDNGVDSSCQELNLSGDLSTINITKCRKLYGFSLSLNDNITDIPDFPAIKEVCSLSIYANVIGEPFDCKNLLPFTDVESISLSGNMIGLEHLFEFKNLKHINLRQMPNLKNIPELKNWEKLKSLIAVDIEEECGKELRKELRALKKEREMDYSTVSGLRNAIWYTTEYGIPFTSWQKNEKKAVKKYKDTAKLLKKANTIGEVKTIIVNFTEFFNNFDNIETIEREDIGEAVFQLIEIPKIQIDRKQANEWFDSVRDY